MKKTEKKCFFFKVKNEDFMNTILDNEAKHYCKKKRERKKIETIIDLMFAEAKKKEDFKKCKFL